MVQLRVMFSLRVQILIFCLIPPFNLFGQTSMKIGLEMGVSITAKQDRYYSSPGSWDHFELKEFISPTMGIVYDIKFSDHFKTSTGIKYESVGLTEKLKSNTFGQYEPETKYAKLCLPVKVSYIIGGGESLRPSINIGYIQNYLLSGQREGMDLFKTDVKQKRLTGQFSLGLSICTRKIEITSSYVIGKIIEWGWNNHLTSPGGAHYTRTTTFPFKNSEYCFTVVFYPFEFQKRRFS